MANNLPKPDSNVGGYLVGEQNGKTVLHENGDKGGLLVGKRHSDGGIKAINQSTGQPIEVETLEASITSKVAESNQQYQFEGKQMTGKAVLSEINQKGGGVAFRTGGVVDNRQGAPLQYKGGEIIITRPSVLDTTKRNFNGKMMTNLEIASYINQQNGGVAFSEKNIPQSIKTNGSSYEYGGKIMKDTEIVSSCGCIHSHMESGGKVDNESQIIQAFLDEQERNVYGDAACNNVASQFGISVSEVKNIIKNSGMITDNDEWLNSINFNWDSFSISELNDYVHAISDINIHYFGLGRISNSGVNKLHEYLTKSSLKNKKFTIGKVGKEISINKGEENLYADVIVYDAENKEYTIGLYSKDNHDGLKAIVNDVVKKFESGGKLDKPVPTRSAIGASAAKNVVLGIDGEGRTIMIIADGYDNKGSYIGASEVLTDNDSGFYIGSGGWSDEDAERLFPNYKQRHAEISTKIKAFAEKHPTVKGMTFFDTRKGKRARIVSVTRGLVNWEYYKNDGVTIDTGNIDSMDTKQFLYLLDSGAYQSLRFVGDEKHEHGGAVSKSSHKFNKEVMKMNANAKNEVIQIVLTQYSGGVGEKEEHLKRVFEMNNIPYSREAVKDIYYSDYTSRGGWRDFEYFTSWIFDKENQTQMADGGRLKIKFDRSSLGDEIINAISERSSLSAAEFNMKKAKEYLDYVNSTEGLEEVRPKAQRDYEFAKKAYSDLRGTKAFGGTIDNDIDFPSFEKFVDDYTYNTSKSFGDLTHHMYNLPISIKNRKSFSSTKHTKEDAQKDIYVRARYEAVAHIILDELKPIFPDAKIDFSGKRKLAIVEFWAHDAELPLNQKMVIVFERGGWGYDDDRSKGLINFVPEYYVYEQGDMKYPDDVVKKEFKTLGEAINYAKQFSPAKDDKIMAKGGKIKESYAVNAIKKENIFGGAVGFKLRYDGIDSVILFAVEKGNEMVSTWIDTEYFNKPEFRTESGYYQMGAINKEIVRLLTEHELDSIASEDVKSDLLKTLYIDPNNPPTSDFDKYAEGGLVDSNADDYYIVDNVKTVKVSPKSTVVRISHSGDTTLDLLSIEDNGAYLMSVWVDTSWFDRAVFKTNGKYNINAIKDEVIRLLKLGELDVIAKKGLSSSALKFLRMVDKEPVGKIRLADIPAELKTFMPQMQQKAIVGTTEHWEVIQRLTDIISKMPKTYDTNNISANDKTVYLHYFSSGSDWYIVEKDMYSDQFQVYGYAILNGDMIDAEWGYISLPDLFSTNRVELDFYFKPITFKQLMINKGEYDDDSTSESVEVSEKPKSSVYTDEGDSIFSNADDVMKYFKTPPISIKIDEDDKQEYVESANRLITTERINRLRAVGLPDDSIKAVFWGYDVIDDNIQADTEFNGYVSGVLTVMPEYYDKIIDSIVETVKAGFYEAGLKYPEVKKWESLFTKYGISTIPVELVEEHATGDLYQYALWANEEKGIYITKSTGYKSMSNGKVHRDSFTKFNKDIEFGGEYSGIVTKDLDTLIHILNDILADKKNYVKDLDFLSNRLGGVGADYFIEQQRNKRTESKIAEELNTMDSENTSAAPEDNNLNQATVSAKVGGGTRKDQYELNAEIKLLVQSKGNDRSKYSAEEIDMLKLYSGSGGLIKQGAKGSGILDQFYTPNNIISRMWGLALKYGFKFEGSNILEPAVGVGRFLQYIPKDAKPKYILGYDVDEVAATISQVLYPDYKIINASFETMFFQGRRHIGLAGVNTQFDLVITNPPYREYASEYAPLGEKKATGAFTFEMYFMMRGVDVLKEGGLLVMIIPSTFMANDNKYNDFKEKLGAKVDFLEGYRLPSGSFDRTEVTTDILVMRKKINTPEPPKSIKETKQKITLIHPTKGTEHTFLVKDASRLKIAEINLICDEMNVSSIVVNGEHYKKKDNAPSFMEDATPSNTGIDSIDEQIAQLKRQIANVNETLENDMEAWERKEYEQVRNDYTQELTELLNRKEPEQPVPTIKKKVKTWGGHVPAKDDFQNPITDEFVDGMTSLGGWAMMSPKSFKMYGTGIGAGRGQKYQKQGDDWVKIG